MKGKGHTMSWHDTQTLTHVLLLLHLKLRGGIETYNQETQDVRVEGGEGGRGGGTYRLVENGGGERQRNEVTGSTPGA